MTNENEMTQEEMMEALPSTGIYIRVKRNDKMENVLIEDLSKAELHEKIIVQAEEPTDWIFPIMQVLNNYKMSYTQDIPSMIDLMQSGYDKDFYFGSCQYSTIKWFIDEINKGTPLMNKEVSRFQADLIPTVSPTKLEAIVANIKIKLLVDIKGNLHEPDNQEELDNNIEDIKSIANITDVYNYMCSRSWDLWGTNNFVMPYFNILPQISIDFSNNKEIALSLNWLLKNNIIENDECFKGFDT